MSTQLRDVLLRQLDVSWQLATYHFDGLSTEECLWSPRPVGPRLVAAGPDRWIAALPTHERYDLGPASAGWLTWHMLYWWSMVWDRTWGEGTLDPATVGWPGSAHATVEVIEQKHAQWRHMLASASAADLQSHERTRWPFANRTLADLAAWVNIELMKNAAELGYARFLYAVRDE